jgi:hypothetical protein
MHPVGVEGPRQDPGQVAHLVTGPSRTGRVEIRGGVGRGPVTAIVEYDRSTGPFDRTVIGVFAGVPQPPSRREPQRAVAVELTVSSDRQHLLEPDPRILQRRQPMGVVRKPQGYRFMRSPDPAVAQRGDPVNLGPSVKTRKPAVDPHAATGRYLPGVDIRGMDEQPGGRFARVLKEKTTQALAAEEDAGHHALGGSPLAVRDGAGAQIRDGDETTAVTFRRCGCAGETQQPQPE